MSKDDVLDVASGTGVAVLALDLWYPKVVGIDPTHEMLEEPRRMPQW